MKRSILILILLAGVSMAIASCSADRILLGSDPGQSGDLNGLSQKVMEADGETLDFWIASTSTTRSQPNQQPAAFVLFFSGKGTRVEPWMTGVALAWNDYPVEVWGANYPGFGKTTGPAEMDRVAPGALRAYDALAKHAAGRPIYIQAASFGTAPALYIAAHRPVAGLVLHKPPALKQMIVGTYGWWNLWVLAGPVAQRVPDELDSLANATKTTAPAAFLLHGADEITPVSYQRDIANAYAGPKRIVEMPWAKHDDGVTREAGEELHAATRWMWEQPR